MSLAIRTADTADIDGLADLWHETWHEAHAAHVPADLVAARTVADFRDRLPALLSNLRMAGPSGAPEGLCITRGNEMHQLFVGAQARGTGLARALLADAEARLRQGGARDIWLDVLRENARAIHFYEREGWQLGDMADMPLDTAEGTGRFNLRLQIMTKTLL